MSAAPGAGSPAAPRDLGDDEERIVETRSPEETAALGARLGKRCRGGEVILIEGPLGAGKTCFTQGIARGLGVTATVRSPSFVLLACYRGRVRLAHLDLYRIEDPGAIDDLGLEEELDDAVLVIEWGEKVRDRWPRWIHLRLEETGERERRIHVRALGREERSRVAQWLGTPG